MGYTKDNVKDSIKNNSFHFLEHPSGPNHPNYNKPPHNKLSLRIKEFGIKKPFLVTKVGEYYMLYNCLNTFTIAKIIGLKEVPCKIITNKMMNNRIKQLNFSRRDHKLKEIEL